MAASRRITNRRKSPWGRRLSQIGAVRSGVFEITYEGNREMPAPRFASPGPEPVSRPEGARVAFEKNGSKEVTFHQTMQFIDRRNLDRRRAERRSLKEGDRRKEDRREGARTEPQDGKTRQ